VYLSSRFMVVIVYLFFFFFFFSSRRRHTRSYGDWSSDVCSSDLLLVAPLSGVCGLYLSAVRRYGLGRLPLTRSALDLVGMLPVRSEERRVGKEGRCRWWTVHER